MNALKWSTTEIEIVKKWLLNIKKDKIAKDLDTTEAKVTRTINKFVKATKTTYDSMAVMDSMGLLEIPKSLKLTEKGKRSLLTYDQCIEKIKAFKHRKLNRPSKGHSPTYHDIENGWVMQVIDELLEDAKTW